MAASRKRGRRAGDTKLTPAVQADIVKYASAGVPRRFIAAAVGIGVRTLAEYVAKGKRGGAGNDVYRQFLHALKAAESRSVAGSVGRIKQAAMGGAVVERKSVTVMGVTTVTEKVAQPLWTADAWLLERRYPEEFSASRAELRELQKAYQSLEARLLKLTGGDGATPVAEKPA